MKRAILILMALFAGLAQAADTAYEQLTVSTTAVGLAAATVGGSDGVPQRTYCLLTLATADIRWRVDGVNPDTNTGHIFASGATLALSSHSDIVTIRFIRDGGSDAALSATCW